MMNILREKGQQWRYAMFNKNQTLLSIIYAPD